MSSAEIYQFPGCEERETFADYWEYCQQMESLLTEQEAFRRFSMTPEDYFRKSGWVYVLTNPLMRADVFKIGMTTGRIQSRMRQLYSTGVPVEFECIYAHWFSNCVQAEKFVHSELSEYRVSESREFFCAELQQIKFAIMRVDCIGDVHPDHMVDVACARHEYATANERVNGKLVIEKLTPLEFDLEECPF